MFEENFKKIRHTKVIIDYIFPLMLKHFVRLFQQPKQYDAIENCWNVIE